MLDFWTKVGLGAVGTVTSYLFGGWSAILEVLFFMVVLDFITGLYASYTVGKLSSSVGFKGIARKVFLFLVVATAHKIDMALGSEAFLRNLTIYFYLANEGISLLENMGRAGLPIPTFLTKALLQIKRRSEEDHPKM